MCTVGGAYGVSGSIFDVIVMFIFGLIGYFFEKLNYGVAPIVLGLILGGMAETHFRRGFLMYNGDMSVLLTRPVSAVLI